MSLPTQLNTYRQFWNVCLTCGGKCIIVDQRATLVEKKWHQVLSRNTSKNVTLKPIMKLWKNNFKHAHSGFTLRFMKRNLTSASICESLLLSVTCSIPSVPLFSRGLVQPHSTDTSRRLSSSTAHKHTQTPCHFIHNSNILLFVFLYLYLYTNVLLA